MLLWVWDALLGKRCGAVREGRDKIDATAQRRVYGTQPSAMAFTVSWAEVKHLCCKVASTSAL